MDRLLLIFVRVHTNHVRWLGEKNWWCTEKIFCISVKVLQKWINVCESVHKCSKSLSAPQLKNLFYFLRNYNFLWCSVKPWALFFTDLSILVYLFTGVKIIRYLVTFLPSKWRRGIWLFYRSFDACEILARRTPDACIILHKCFYRHDLPIVKI